MSETPGWRWLEWEDLYDDTDPVPLIIERMAKPPPPSEEERGLGEHEYPDLGEHEYPDLEEYEDPLDLKEHEASLRELVDKARWTYLEDYSDWLRRSSKEGTHWRPHRRLSKNCNSDEPGPVHDYSGYRDDETHDGFGQSWDKWWEEHWAKPVSPKTGARARNPGTFQIGTMEGGQRLDLERHVGRPLGKPPLVKTYHLVNRWWRSVLKDVFRPNFDGPEAHDTDMEALRYLNPAARLLLLVAREVDPRCTWEHCRRVHEESDQHQDTTRG